MEKTITREQMQSAIDIMFGDGEYRPEEVKEVLEGIYREFSHALLTQAKEEVLSVDAVDFATSACWMMECYNKQLKEIA